MRSLHLTLSMLGKNPIRRNFEIFLLLFPRNRLWHFMQTTIFMKCRSLLSGKSKKKHHEFVVCCIHPESDKRNNSEMKTRLCSTSVIIAHAVIEMLAA